MSDRGWSARARGIGSLLRRAPIEAVLLSLAGCGLVYTMIATGRAAGATDRRGDLTYARAVEELSSTLQGLGPERVARLMRDTIVHAGGEVVTVDTLAVVADTLAEPALATGGFVRDQVARFNDAAVRQALAQPRAWGQMRRPENATVLRIVRSDAGAARLDDRADAASLTVLSPSAERTWRTVLTSDARDQVSLIGYVGTIPLLPGDASQRASFNGRECETHVEAARALVYCGASLASGVRRFYDLAVGARDDASTITLDTYRSRSAWLDGNSATVRERRIPPGAVGELRATGPFLVSNVSSGHLAGRQWVNGRTGFVSEPLGTLGFFSRAGRSATWPGDGSPVRLSLDAALSADLELAARSFFASRRAQLDAMSVVVVDLASGRVRAIAEPWRDRPDDPLVAFEPRPVGSVVKPILAAALLARRPELADLVIDYGGPSIDRVAGITLRKPFRNDANGCVGRIGLTEYFRCSSNQYAAELLFRSLLRDGFSPRVSGGDEVPREILERSAVADGLAAVFDVDAYAGRTAGRTVPFWDVTDRAEGGVAPAVRDPSLMPYESRPWLLGHRSSGTPVDWIARYAFGGWENRWTLLGVAQSYARIAAGRDVQLTFLDDGAPRATARPPAGVERALARVRAPLAEVGANGTAMPLNEVLRRTLGPMTVLSKTGTLNEVAPDDVAVKALAFAVGQPTSALPDAPLRCGVVVVTYFDFDRDAIQRLGASALPAVHLDFSTRYLPEVLRRHWPRVTNCSAAGVRSGP